MKRKVLVAALTALGANAAMAQSSVTLYGLVEVVQGPGLGFSRLTAPFRHA